MRVLHFWQFGLILSGVTVVSCNLVVDFDEFEFKRQACTQTSDCPVPDPSNPCLVAHCVKGGCSPEVAAHAPCETGVCDEAGQCVGCIDGSDCPSHVCEMNICVCDDGAKNTGEADVDCGGSSCPPCASTSACASNGDCIGDVCTDGVCSPCGDLDWAQWVPGDAEWATRALTVRDERTGLTWQREAPKQTSWNDAKTYCETLILEGTAKWRLPTRIELSSIVDYTRASPAIDIDTFPGKNDDAFWSATPKAGSDTDAWYVSFDSGNVDISERTKELRVRCVR